MEVCTNAVVLFLVRGTSSLAVGSGNCTADVIKTSSNTFGNGITFSAMVGSSN